MIDLTFSTLFRALYKLMSKLRNMIGTYHTFIELNDYISQSLPTWYIAARLLMLTRGDM